MIFMIFFFKGRGICREFNECKKMDHFVPLRHFKFQSSIHPTFEIHQVNDRESHGVKQTKLAVVGFCETKNHYEFLHTYSRMVVTVLLFLVFICFLSQEMILQIMPNGVPQRRFNDTKHICTCIDQTPIRNSRIHPFIDSKSWISGYNLIIIDPKHSRKKKIQATYGP